MITDEDATKPSDWLEHEPDMVPDPDAEKPEEWDVSQSTSSGVLSLAGI